MSNLWDGDLSGNFGSVGGLSGVLENNLDVEDCDELSLALGDVDIAFGADELVDLDGVSFVLGLSSNKLLCEPLLCPYCAVLRDV